MGHLTGKVAVISGGAGGIGTQISKIFAEQGAKVVVADSGVDVEGNMGVDPTRVNAVVQQIRDAGGEAVPIIGDVAEMDVAENVIRTAIDTYGKLDILVAAHGIVRERMIFNMTEDEWDAVVKAHLKGCFTLTKFASIHWRQVGNGGRIIYLTSGAAIRGDASQSNYSAAQAGKIGLMLSSANALRRYGVTANCISPRASTRMTDRNRGDDRTIPSGEGSGTERDPANIVPPIVYLASEAGAEISGRVVGVEGHRITLYREMYGEKSIFSEEPFWDIDKLFEVMPLTLATEPDISLPHRFA